MQHRFAGVLSSLLLVTAPAIALAAPPQGAQAGDAPAGSAVTPPPPQQADDATRAAARRIAEEGLQLFDTGRWAEALDRFERAGAAVKAPTMTLMAARSLEKLGRLVEASERYHATAAMQLDADASAAFRKAQEDATKERAALLPRIPSLVIDAGAAAPAEAAVTLDGKPIAASLLGSPIPVDPGAHTVILTRGEKALTERFSVKEGETKRLAFAASEPAGAASPLRTVGWISLAAGGAGLVGAAVAGGMLLSTKAQLDGAGCKEGQCPPQTAGDVATYNDLRPVTTGLLTAGAVLAVAGGLAILVAPSSPPKTTGARAPGSGPRRAGVAVQPLIGVGSVGLRGVF